MHTTAITGTATQPFMGAALGDGAKVSGFAAAAPNGIETGALGLAGSRVRFERDAEIYAEGDDAACFYEVVSGVVRSSKLLADGRRQIGAFLLPGDIFGFEAGAEHRFAAEAVTDCTVMVHRRRGVEALAARDAGLAQRLFAHTVRNLERTQEHMLLLGRKNAAEKVAAFLLDMAERAPAGDGVDLPMTRYDIADYLGLTIETVSRTLSQLERQSAIALPSTRHIVLKNRAALRRLNA